MKTTRRERAKQYLFVIRELTSREIKRKYARSYLGIVWSILNPLLTMAVLSMIFSTMFKRSIDNFPIYLLTGQIIWGLFSGATNTSMSALVDNRTLLMKVKLPKQTFVLARAYTALVNFLYTFVAYILMMLVFRVRPSWLMLLFVADVFFTMLFATGIGYALSIAYVFFADIKYLYSILLTLWMYMSAIFYPVTSLPQTMQKIIGNNPVFVMIDIARKCMIYNTMPHMSEWIKLICWSVVSFVAGYLIFMKNENKVMQKI